LWVLSLYSRRHHPHAGDAGTKDRRLAPDD
jgi:hypothetical protein